MCRRRWANINPTMDQNFVFAGFFYAADQFNLLNLCISTAILNYDFLVR